MGQDKGWQAGWRTDLTPIEQGLLGFSLVRLARATFIAPAALEALKSGAAGEVHSVFERTFNILIGGELVGVAQSGVSRNPINLITDIPASESMSALGVCKGMRVQKVGGRLLIGEVLEISLEGAELWQPKTRAEKCLDSKSIKRNLELAKKLAADKAGREGLGQLLSRVDEISASKVNLTPDLSAVARAVLPLLVQLLDAVKSEDIRGVGRVTQKLIGLGPGLSPSADDALSGFMAALWWVSHSVNRGVDSMEEINRTIVDQASNTTLLSRQLLQHAARGEVNERVQEFLETILSGAPSDVSTKVDRVLEIGETSGADMMVGLLLGARVGLEMKS